MLKTSKIFLTPLEKYIKIKFGKRDRKHLPAKPVTSIYSFSCSQSLRVIRVLLMPLPNCSRGELRNLSSYNRFCKKKKKIKTFLATRSCLG